MDTLIAMLFGYPSVLVSLIAAGIGIYTRQANWIIVSALVLLPFAFYLSATPLLRGVGMVLPAFHLGAWSMTRANRPYLAGACLLPLVVTVGWLMTVSFRL